MNRFMLTALICTAFAFGANAAGTTPNATAKPKAVTMGYKTRAQAGRPVKIKQQSNALIEKKDLAIVTEGKKTIVYTPLFESKSIKIKSNTSSTNETEVKL
jgi:hypothetical protein